MSLILTSLGLIGVGLIIVGYFLLQQGRLTAHHPKYLWLNLVGALCILASLYVDWNLPAFIIEIFWLGITLYGFMGARRHRNQAHTLEEGITTAAGQND